MNDTIILFPLSRRSAVRFAADELATAQRSLEALQCTQQLTEMTADAILHMDLERMIALRDTFAARLGTRRSPRPAVHLHLRP